MVVVLNPDDYDPFADTKPYDYNRPKEPEKPDSNDYDPLLDSLEEIKPAAEPETAAEPLQPEKDDNDTPNDDAAAEGSVPVADADADASPAPVDPRSSPSKNDAELPAPDASDEQVPESPPPCSQPSESSPQPFNGDPRLVPHAAASPPSTLPDTIASAVPDAGKKPSKILTFDPYLDPYLILGLTV